MIRGTRLFKNVLGASLFKGINILFGFLLVRFTIDFAGEERYGIWLTLLSFFTWFSAIEVGIGNSYRNDITKWFAEKVYHRIKSQLSKAYKTALTIYLSVILCLTAVTLLFPLEELFVPEETAQTGMKWLFIISTALYLMHFVFALLNTVLLSIHKASTTFLISAVQNGILLLGIILFKYTNVSASLALLCIWFSAVPLGIWAFFTLFSYRNSLKHFAPSLAGIIKEKQYSIKSLDSAFFIIQICTLIIFTTDNLIIIQFLSSGAEVARYNIVFKYFNILTVAFNLVLIPYWASFTEAAHQKDRSWIKKHIRVLMLFLAALSLVGLVMIYFSDFAFELWLGTNLVVSNWLVVAMCISVLLTSWNNIFSYFLNSIGATRLQKNLLILSAILNVPLSVMLIPHFGSAGVILATIIALLPLSIALPVQYWTVIKSLK